MMKNRKLKDRYQCKPWYIRLYRRAKYQPLAIFSFFLWLGWWVLHACPVSFTPLPNGDYYYDSRWETIKLAWKVIAKSWTIPAGWYYTLEEVMSDLRSSRGKN